MKLEINFYELKLYLIIYIGSDYSINIYEIRHKNITKK